MPRISMFLDSEFPPDPRVENEAITLIENGFEVYLLSFTRDKNKPVYELINGIHLHRQYITKLIYKLSALAYTIPLYHLLVSRFISRFIKRTTPDFLHIHDMLIARAVFWQNKKQLPVILDLHENRPEIMKHYPHLQTGFGKLLIRPMVWKKWQARLVDKATKVITVTNLAKNQLLEESGIGESKVLVVPNTIKKEVFYSNRIDQSIKKKFKGKKVILYLGDTGLRRGTDTAIKAIAKLADRFPDILLVLVGQSSEDKFLHELVHEHRVEAFVKFEGWQDLSLFPSYIEASMVTLSPLKRNAHHDTTYANKLFQYMAHGKPLIVSDCPAQEQLIKAINCGLIYRADDSGALANQIARLLTDPKMARKFGENAKQAVEEKYHWDYTSFNLRKLYLDFTKEVD